MASSKLGKKLIGDQTCQETPSLFPYLIEHPLSITQAGSLFPTDWATVVNEKLEFSYPWSDKYDDPSDWLVIPEFDVLPRAVSFQGFDLLVPWMLCPESHEIKNLIKTARGLAQKQFKTIKEMRDAISSESYSTKNSAAYVYEHVIVQLSVFLNLRLDNEDRMQALADAASDLTSWAADGPASAYSRLVEGARRGGKKTASQRQILGKNLVRPASVVKAARAAGWPERSWGINKQLAREFNRTATRIGQILRDEKRKLENELP